MHRASNSLNDETDGQLLALRFGPFELDVRSGELRRNGTTVRLQPQPFKVLMLLACRPGDVVTREEVQAEVWPAGTFVDFEQSLNFCIRQIRSALGGQLARYVRPCGYRWVWAACPARPRRTSVREWPRPVLSSPARRGPAGLEVASRAPRALVHPRGGPRALVLAPPPGSARSRTPGRRDRIPLSSG
jgi:hypothetical protein